MFIAVIGYAHIEGRKYEYMKEVLEYNGRNRYENNTKKSKPQQLP